MKIAFGYKARSGKDTAVDYMIRTYGGTRVSFATPLYDILAYAQSRCGFSQAKDRQFLQYIGTDWARKQDPDVWVRLALESIRKITWDNEFFGLSAKHIYVSDLRFTNEFNALKKDGFICVKVVRNVDRGDIPEHPSETELDSIPDKDWDIILYNNSSIDDYYQALSLIGQGQTQHE